MRWGRQRVEAPCGALLALPLRLPPTQHPSTAYLPITTCSALPCLAVRGLERQRPRARQALPAHQQAGGHVHRGALLAVVVGLPWNVNAYRVASAHGAVHAVASQSSLLTRARCFACCRYLTTQLVAAIRASLPAHPPHRTSPRSGWSTRTSAKCCSTPTPAAGACTRTMSAR